MDAITARIVLSEHFEELLLTYEVWLPRAARVSADNTTFVWAQHVENIMSAAWTLRRLWAHSQAWKGFPSSVLVRVIAISLKLFALVRPVHPFCIRL